MEIRIANFKKRIIFLLLLCINAATTATTCNLGCKSSTGSILNYLPGHEYEYTLETHLNVAVHNGTEQDKDAANNQLKLNANAKLYAQGNCVYTLQINNVKVSSSVGGVAKQQLQHLQQPIQFSMENNGQVQENLCIKNSDMENHYGLNIKRAIVSLLQTHVAHDTDVQNEIDVYGVCNTRTSERDGTIIKVRNLNHCQQREHINTGLMVAPAGLAHENDGRIYNTPYLQADYYKHTKLNADKVVEQVTVDEIYRQGAGAHKSETIGANAKVRTVLKLIKSGSGQAPNMNGDIQSVSIKFDAMGIKESNLKNIQVLREAIDALVPRLQPQVEQGSAQQFAEIVRLMRTSDYDSLLELSNQKGLAHQVYLDALFRVGTAPAARAILKLLPKLNDKERFLAISALNLIKHVDYETIKAAASTLGQQNTNNNIYLAIGNLVKKYCHTNTEVNCGKVIDEISKQYVQAIKQCKATNTKEEEHILGALKGIGNMQYVNAALMQTMGYCLVAQHDDISQRLRVAALQAVASTASCNKELQQRALQILQDIQEDSEIRIEAYLVAVECTDGNEQVVQTLLNLLDKEPSQQLQGFIFTHLRTLRDSTDATREAQKKNLERVIEKIPHKLPLANWRKFSHNEEFSYKLPAMGLSASGDAKVIYSQQPGFLPRSARLNMTSEIFGHNFNLLQLNVRQENIERILEYYIGPKGLLNKDFDELIKTLGSGGHPRARRSIMTDTQKFAKKYKNYGEKKSKSYTETPLNFDLSLKVFGSELGFLSLGDNIPQTVEDLMYHLTQIFDNTKSKLKDYSKQYHMHVLFLDSEMLYTTSAGIPLSLSAQGFATTKYDVATQIDVDTILAGEWTKPKYRIKFVPSIDAQVQLRLGYITPLINSGVRISTQLHTVTGSDVYLNFNGNGKGFKMELELPNEQIDLIHIKTATNYFVHEADKVNAKLIPLTADDGVAEKPTTPLCFNQVEEYIGFDFCISTNIVDMSDWGNNAEHVQSMAFLRPIDLHLFLRAPKKIMISAEQIENAQERSWQLNYATPGTTESHDTKMLLSLNNEPQKKARLELLNPKMQFSAELGIQSDAKELVLYAQYVYNADQRRSKIGFHKVANNEYEPIIEIHTIRGDKLNDIGGYTATGRLHVTEGGQGVPRTYTFDKFAIKHVPTNEQFTQLNGWIKLQKTAVLTEMHIVTPQAQNFFIKSELGLQQQYYTAAFFINNEETPENVMGGSVNAKIQPNEVDIKLDGKAQAWHFELHNDVKYKQSADDIPKLESLDLQHQLNIIHKQQPFANGKLHIQLPTRNELNINAELQKQKHSAKFDLRLLKNQKENGDYLADIKAYYNKHSISIMAKCDINENGRYAVDNKLVTSWGTLGTVQGQIGGHFMPEDIYIDLNGNFQSSSKQKPQQLHLKIIGGSEKTTGDFQFTHDGNEIVKFNGDWQHTAEKTHNVKSSLLIKSVLSTIMDFKLGKSGKGDLNINAQLLKGNSEQNKKLDLNSKFHVQHPNKYDLEATLLLNNDKDAPLMHIKTENINEKSKFTTNNIIEFMQQKYEFNMHLNGKGEWRNNGEVAADFNLKLPSGQIVEGVGKRKLLTNPKTGLITGNGEWSITQKLPDGKQRSLSATGKLEKMLMAQKIFINDVNYVYTNVDGKKLNAKMQIKHVPKNGGKSIKSHALDLNFALQGELLPHEIHFNLKSDAYNSHLGNYEAKFDYGDKMNALIKGNHDFTENKPFIHDLLLSVTLTQSHFKNFKIHTNGKWIKPANGNAGQLEHQFQYIFGDKQFDWKFNAEGNEAAGKYDLYVKRSDALSDALEVSGDFERNAQKLKYSLNAKIGDQKSLKTQFDAEFKDNENLNVHYKLTREFGTQIDLNLATENNPQHYGWNLEAKQNDDNDKYIFNGKIFKPASNKQGVAGYLSMPQVSKKITVICTYEKLGEGKGNLQLELSEVFGLDLKSSLSMDVHEFENFDIELLWNSEKLQLKEYAFKLKAENGNKLQFNLKNAQETIVNGVLSQENHKEGNNKYIIDGQGQVEYRGQKQQGNFRLIRQIYYSETDKESGISYSLNGKIGTKNAVANLKLTNKEFNMKLSTCEEKKQCSNLQMQSLIAVDEAEMSRHSLLVLVDLRELGYPYEFELQSKTQRQGLKAQYSLDSKLISNNDYRYELLASLSSHGAGHVQLNLPKREILLKLEQQVPGNQEIFGHYEQSIALWLNHKQKPDEVTRLKLSGNVQGELMGEDAKLNADANIKLEHPQMRALSLSGKLVANKVQQTINTEIEMDVFKKAEQKLHIITEFKNAPGTLDLHLKHKLLAPSIDFNYNFVAYTTLKHQANSKDWKYTSGLELNAKFHNTEELSGKSFAEFNANEMKLQVEALKESLFILESNWHKKDKGGFKTETKLQMFSQEPVKMSTEMELTAAKMNLKRENAFDAEASFKLGQDIIVRVNGDKDKKYIDGRIALDTANFLQTHYEGNLDELKEFLEKNEKKLQEQTKMGLEKMKQRIEKIGGDVKKQQEFLAKSLPDFMPIQKTIKTNMEEIVQELEADPMIKQIAVMSRKLLMAVEKFMKNFYENLNKFYERAHQIFEDVIEKLRDILKNGILPLWEDFVMTVSKIISQVRVQLVEMQMKLWQMFMGIVEKYAETLKPYGKVVHDALKTINDANQELIKVLSDEFKHICDELQEFFKNFNENTWKPFVERMQAQWKQWKLAQQFADIINQLIDQLQLVLPQTPETSEFLQQLQTFITQKLNNEPTTTSTNLQSLLSLAIKAIQSLITEVSAVYKQQLGGMANNFDAGQYMQPISHLVVQTVETLSKLPTLLTLRISVVNFVFNELATGGIRWHYDSALKLLQYPFDMTARVVNGQQFVTYDGLYAEYKGENCRYILTQDSIDQNFTIVAQQQHDKLRTITLITRDNEMFELSDNGNLKLNGNPIEYPYHGVDLHAWQIYYTVALRSQYGVELTCVKDLSLCHIQVKGFYAGRLRGLLGNANTEKFDDRLLPEGTLAMNNVDVATAYTLGKCTSNAANVDAIEKTEDAEICDEIFNWKSTLSAGYLLLDQTPYRQGCNMAVAGINNNDEEQQQMKACEWALAYVSALRLQGIPINMPNNCLKCGKNQPLEHELNVKLPGNKVDILFVIDLKTSSIVLDTLVKPLLQDIRESFKARSFNDIQIGVIVYNETQRYPALLSSNGGKLNYAGNLADIDLSHAPSASYCKDCFTQIVGNSKILDIISYIETLFMRVLPNAEKTAYQVALKYPFRAQASSVIVSVRNNPLSPSTMLNLLEAEIADGIPNLEKAIVHLIAPIPKMSVEGISNEKLIGFNSRLIATLDGKDPKKRSKLQFENNAGIDLILQTGGWIFNTDHIESLKAQDQKKALTQITNTIADTSFKTEQLTECKCETVYGMFAEYKCTVKSTNFVPNKKVKSK